MIFFWGTPLKEGKIPEQLRSYVTNLEVHGQLFMKIYIPEVLEATEKTAFVELLKELRFLSGFSLLFSSRKLLTFIVFFLWVFLLNDNKTVLKFPFLNYLIIETMCPSISEKEREYGRE